MKKTWKPLTAGILTIIAGAVGIGRGIAAVVLGAFIGASGGIAGELSDLIQEWAGIAMPGMPDFSEIIVEILGLSSVLLIAIGAVSLALGIVALIGGIHAIKRRKWGLALTGAILSLFSVPQLGVLSIIFVSLGRDEFVSPEVAAAESK